jgi:hypothetical protein
VNGLLHPVGPEPAAVYWRRRAVVIGGLVVVVAVIVMIVNALAHRGDGDAKPPPSSPPASAPATSAPVIPAACEAGQLTVVLKPTADSFTPAEPVVFNADVTNTGKKACAVTPGPETVVLHVVSGTDRIFDSADCAKASPSPPGDPVVIGPGQVGMVPVTWDAKRSTEGCKPVADGDQPRRHREATYIATLTVNGAASEQARFLLVP